MDCEYLINSLGHVRSSINLPWNSMKTLSLFE